MRKIKILFVCSTDTYAGANRSLLLLANGLMGLDKYELRFLLPKRDKTGDLCSALSAREYFYTVEEYSNCVTKWEKQRIIESVLRYSLNVFRYFKTQSNYKNILSKTREWQPDIIHTNSSVCDLGIRLSKDLNIPHVWHVREVLDHYSMIYLFPNHMRKYIRTTAQIVFISDFLKNTRSDFNENNNHCVIYNGFTTEIGIRKTRKLSGVIKLFLAGTLSDSKGQLDAVEAVALLVNDFGVTNISLQICGADSMESEYAKKITECVKNNKIEKYVEILPFQTDIDSYRREADIALQCSILEGMGRVTVEAMMAKVLVIGADSGATSELIIDGVTGFLYPPRDPEKLADVLLHVINFSDYERVVDAAYEWAVTSFDFKRISNQVDHIYETIYKSREDN